MVEKERDSSYDWAVDHLQDTVDQLSAFLDDLATCKHVVWELTVGGSPYVAYVLLTKGMPIVVYTDFVVWGSPGHPMVNSRDWDDCEVVRAAYDSSEDITILKLLKGSQYEQNHRVPQFISLYNGSYHPYIPFYETPFVSLSPRECWKYVPKDLFNYTPTKQRIRSAVTGGYDSAWSEQNWPELVGVKTAYIDNVGVFIPDYAAIDFNLSHSLGKDLVGLVVERAPNSQVEGDKAGWDQAQSWLEWLFIGQGQSGMDASGFSATAGGSQVGGVAGAIIGTYKQFMSFGGDVASRLRLTYPRIRAFGRQLQQIPSYNEYVSRVKLVVGSDNWQVANGRDAKVWNNKIITLQNSSEYTTWVNTLKPYLNLVNN